MNTLLDKNAPVLRQTAELVDVSEFESAWLKNLVQTNQAAKAQALILQELQVEFGGSAAAAAAYPGAP